MVPAVVEQGFELAGHAPLLFFEAPLLGVHVFEQGRQPAEDRQQKADHHLSDKPNSAPPAARRADLPMDREVTHEMTPDFVVISLRSCTTHGPSSDNL